MQKKVVKKVTYPTLTKKKLKNADILGLILTAYGYRKIYVMVYEVPFLQETHNKLH